MKTTELTIRKYTDETLPVYCRYNGQYQPQPAYICLDIDGNITVEYNGNIGSGTSSAHWHGLERHYTIPANCSGSQIDELIEKIKPFLEIVHSGHTEEWDGHNYVGKLTEEAVEAEVEIEYLFQYVTGDIEIWEVDEYFQNSEISDLIEEDETIEHASERLEKEATENNIYLTGDIEKYLKNRLED